MLASRNAEMSRCIPGGISVRRAAIPTGNPGRRADRRPATRSLRSCVSRRRTRIRSGYARADAACRSSLVRRRRAGARTRRAPHSRARRARLSRSARWNLRAGSTGAARVGRRGSLRRTVAQLGDSNAGRAIGHHADPVQSCGPFGRAEHNLHPPAGRHAASGRYRLAAPAPDPAAGTFDQRAATAARSRSPNPRADASRISASIASITGRRSWCAASCISTASLCAMLRVQAGS